MMSQCQRQMAITIIYCLLTFGFNNLIINGEITDRSESELDDIKNLAKRDTNNAGSVTDLVRSEDVNRNYLADLDQRFNELLYSDNVDKRVLESSESLDLNNFDHPDPTFYLWEKEEDNSDEHTFDENDEHFEDNDKRGVDRYSFAGTLGKRAPMGFASQLGKRAPFGFMSQLGKRAPFGFRSQLGKRAPFGFVSQLGKRAPFGFISQLGKRAPFGFMSQLGKRAPFGFVSQLGKRAPFGFISQLGKRAPFGFMSQLGKRAPMGFVSQLGKRSYKYPDKYERRSPMGFMSQLGKREAIPELEENSDDSERRNINESLESNYDNYFYEDINADHGHNQASNLRKRSSFSKPYWYVSGNIPHRLVRGLDKFSFTSRLGKRRYDSNYRFFPQLG